MADQLGRSDRSDPTRYDVLRSAEGQQTESVETQGPTRPEGIYQSEYSIPANPSMAAMQPGMNQYNDAAQARQQEQWEAKQQPEMKQEEKLSADEVKAAYRELAQDLLANKKQHSPPEQQAQLGDD